MEDNIQYQPEPVEDAPFVAFIKEHKVKILIGVSVLLLLANRGLRKEVKVIKKENRELRTKFDEHEKMTKQAAADFSAAKPLMDYYFGPRSLPEFARKN